MKKIDLHTHSTCSDGSFAPAELISYAKQNDISVIALTDHDSVMGLDEAAEEAARQDIEFVPGIEFAAHYKNMEVHILGLKIRYKDSPISELLPKITEVRLERNVKMLRLLNEAGVKITLEDLSPESPRATITRLHFAKAIVNSGVCSTKGEAFAKYLLPTCKTYVPREFIPAEKCIELIKASGGISVLAHATLYNLEFPEIDKMVKSLAVQGLMGLECYYSTFTSFEHQSMMKLAKKYRLYMTGGSDFHGVNKPRIDIGKGYGNLFVPYSLWKALKDV